MGSLWFLLTSAVSTAVAHTDKALRIQKRNGNEIWKLNETSLGKPPWECIGTVASEDSRPRGQVCLLLQRKSYSPTCKWVCPFPWCGISASLGHTAGLGHMSQDGGRGRVAGLQSGLQRGHVAELHGRETAQEALCTSQGRLLVYITVLWKSKETPKYQKSCKEQTGKATDGKFLVW